MEWKFLRYIEKVRNLYGILFTRYSLSIRVFNINNSWIKPCLSQYEGKTILCDELANWNVNTELDYRKSLMDKH